MEKGIRDRFIALWERYFDGAELPIAFFYTDSPASPETETTGPSKPRCVIAHLPKAGRGETLRLEAGSIGCAGGRRYLGFAEEIRPDFEYFLSCGIPGQLEGERYKKSPELVRELMEIAPKFAAPAKYAVFKRWDKLEEADEPDVVIFIAEPDVLSGLFTLANFEEADPNGVFAPFSAGCGSIVQYPYLEKHSKRPRCVLGMFDVSARPYVHENVLAFSAPMNKFTRMIESVDESFLTGSAWHKLRARLQR